MKRYTGTTVRGIRMPIVRKGDDLVRIVSDNLIEAAKVTPFDFHDRDIVGVTESFLARSQANFVSLDNIAEDISTLAPRGDIAIAFPILSRNRFLLLLKGIVKGISGKVRTYLSYPGDEVGNLIIDPINYLENKHKLSSECFNEEEWEKVFGRYIHIFTGIDYVKLYQEVDPARIEIWFVNNPADILQFDKNIILASIHARFVQKEMLLKSGASWVLTLDEVCRSPREDAGYNEEFGLLGSNLSDNDAVKLFPRDSKIFVNKLHDELFRLTGKNIEVLVYGDGAFKDPACGIWELADPVVSPGYTEGLNGTPSEVKLKLIADGTKGDAGSASEIVKKTIADKHKEKNIDNKLALGTTPRRYHDLIGSLCDLTSGSGDKGTPVVHISGYFDTYIDD
ncbi:MAG: coenzyme F420-0:L-glutamate ligase [Synergistaceae bacterium]|nr:coenzyme F420-0:L-glutamate ligase [Synergistaceae bacterium]